MKTLERRYSKTDRIIAKARFSGAVYIRSVILAAMLGGIIAALWLLGDKIETFAFGLLKRPVVHIFTESVMKWALVGAAGVVLFVMLVQSLSIYAKELIVTEDKLVFRKGILFSVNAAIPLTKIITIETRQRLFQRLLCFGTVVIMSDGFCSYTVKGVHSPDRLLRRILKQVEIIKKDSDGRHMQLQLAGIVPKRK